jgi:hypothetical protein
MPRSAFSVSRTCWYTARAVILTASPVQRQHQLRLDLLVERVVSHQPFQVRHHKRMVAQRHTRLDQSPGRL